MGVDFTVVGARARGLRTRFFTRRELEALAGTEPAQLARSLGRSPRLAPAPPEGTSPLELEPPHQGSARGAANGRLIRLEQSVRRTASRHLALLARWAQGESPALEVFFADQDRKSLRALLRGAVQGAPASDRLAGTVPTRTLPNRALEELARLPTPAYVVAALVVLGHPDAHRLLPAAARTGPALLDLELELARGFAQRAGAAARRGDPNLRRFVERRLDVTLAQRALLLAAEAGGEDAERFFVAGGRALTLGPFLEVAGAGAAAGPTLSRLLAGTALAALAAGAQADPVKLEARWLPDELARQRAQERLDPLCSATVLGTLLRLSAQTMDLRRLLLGTAAGAPATTLRSALATPWS